MKAFDTYDVSEQFVGFRKKTQGFCLNQSIKHVDTSLKQAGLFRWLQSSQTCLGITNLDEADYNNAKDFTTANDRTVPRFATSSRN